MHVSDYTITFSRPGLLRIISLSNFISLTGFIRFFSVYTYLLTYFTSLLYIKLTLELGVEILPSSELTKVGTEIYSFTYRSCYYLLLLFNYFIYYRATYFLFYALF